MPASCMTQTSNSAAAVWLFRLPAGKQLIQQVTVIPRGEQDAEQRGRRVVTKTENDLPLARHLLLHLSLKKPTVAMTKDVPNGHELCLGPWRVTFFKARLCCGLSGNDVTHFWNLGFLPYTSDSFFHPKGPLWTSLQNLDSQLRRIANRH